MPKQPLKTRLAPFALVSLLCVVSLGACSSDENGPNLNYSDDQTSQNRLQLNRGSADATSEQTADSGSVDDEQPTVELGPCVHVGVPCPNDQPCVDGQCVCTPDCVDTECGDNGCEGSCGECIGGECVEGMCECEAQCDNAQCGSDGCGGTCGTCESGLTCQDGACVCIPDCTEMECGSDGCGGSCGECDGALAQCVEGGCACTPDCTGKECGADGCGGTCGECSGNLVCADDGLCKTAYRAVLVQDQWSGQCSNFAASGADIDAVGLFTYDGDLLGYWDEVLLNIGTEECNNSYTNPNGIVGEPTWSGEDGNGYVALQGGWVAGEFEGKPIIDSGLAVVVWEFGSEAGGSDESYSVFLGTDLDCFTSSDPESCSILLGDDGYGWDEFLVP